jgi:hypothetical protein
VDTGPLVAIVREKEAAHARWVDALRGLRTPLITCRPAPTEAAKRAGRMLRVEEAL